MATREGAAARTGRARGTVLRAAAAAAALAAPPPAERPRRQASTGPWRQWVHFATVGVMNAVVDVGTLNLMLWAWPPGGSRWVLTVENSLAVALAIANSYVWNTRWTFAAQSDGSLRQAVLFVAQSLLNIAINDAALLVTNGLFLQVGPGWVSVNLSKGVAMIFASSTSFLIMRGYVFATRPGGRR